MDLMTIIFILLILIILVPIGLSIGIYMFVKKRNYNKKIRLIALLPILIVGYFIFDAIYPSEEFYKEDFTEVTGLNFPESGKFIYKTATFPDQFGDYTSISIVTVDRKFYDSLLAHLSKNNFNLIKEDNFFTGDIHKKYNDRYVKKTFSRELNGKIFTVGFLSDKESIIVERVSW